MPSNTETSHCKIPSGFLQPQQTCRSAVGGPSRSVTAKEKGLCPRGVLISWHTGGTRRGCLALCASVKNTARFPAEAIPAFVALNRFGGTWAGVMVVFQYPRGILALALFLSDPLLAQIMKLDILPIYRAVQTLMIPDA